MDEETDAPGWNDRSGERTSDRRVVPWLLFGLALLFGAGYVAAYFATSDRIPRGTTVVGVEIGGLTPAVAESRLADGLSERLERPVRLTALDQQTSVQPEAAGLRVDVPATVRAAGGGRSWDPRRMFEYVAGGGPSDPVLDVDRARLDAAVTALADEVDEPAKDGTVTFADGEADATYSETGVVIDRPAAATAVRQEFLHSEGPVELPTIEAEPEIGDDVVSEAMDSFANPAMSGPVVIRLAGEGVRLETDDIARTLSMEPVDGVLEPQLDRKALIAALEPKMKQIALAPRDARIVVRDGTPRVVQSRTGVTFDPDDVTEPFLDVLRASGGDRVIKVKSKKAQPEFSTADAKALRVTERVSRFTTNFPYAEYRNVNLGRAAELVDGTLLKPGETFSLNGIVGERTAENGFTKGFIISDGVFKEDFGGGVSQIATTAFNAAFFAGLEDVEHKPHSFYIDRYPVGREATVAWPSVDLKFRNDTPYGVLVKASVRPSTPSSPGAATVSMFSTKVWDVQAGKSKRYNFTSPETRRLSGPECVDNTGYGGFDIDVFRRFYKPGSTTLDHREKFTTTYTPSDTVICS